MVPLRPCGAWKARSAPLSSSRLPLCFRKVVRQPAALGLLRGVVAAMTVVVVVVVVVVMVVVVAAVVVVVVVATERRNSCIQRRAINLSI